LGGGSFANCGQYGNPSVPASSVADALSFRLDRHPRNVDFITVKTFG